MRYGTRRKVRGYKPATLSDEQRADLAAVRTARGWNIEPAREDASASEVLVRGYRLLDTLADLVTDTAAEWCARRYPGIDPAEVAARSLDAVARYIGRAGTSKAPGRPGPPLWRVRPRRPMPACPGPRCPRVEV